MISFVIPAHNEERVIAGCIAAIRAAADSISEPYEIIVVDDSSTDATGSLAEEHGARVARVEHRQIAATRNAGARAGEGEVLFFVDADTLATEDAVRAGLQALRAGAAGGGCLFRYDEKLPLWGVLAYSAGIFGARIAKLAGGCFLFCTREAFEAVGGFCERLYAAEEIAFARALKRHGPFVIPRPLVITSARKIPMITFGQIVRLTARLVFVGPESFQDREGLELWYGPRPAASAEALSRPGSTP